MLLVLLSQPVDKGRIATEEDINLVKRLLEKEKQVNPQGTEEYDKMAAQLDGKFEIWIKEYDDCLTVTCMSIEKDVTNPCGVFTFFSVKE